ncbi:MAG: PDDEXK nuclease domain-containing protein [Deltaproteobacteria bacterium]|jgi:predicted nuclease of restriction endonuclease-like (RecB) superfamily|nr:PDDEXK nuclease domain-containing protein [Deltaproteobacteria bacterium]
MKEKKLVNAVLVTEIKQLIEQSRRKVAVAVNSEISMLYWHIGKRINSDVLNHKRAEYGKQIIATLSQHLTSDYGRGWSEKQLHHCLYTVETFSDEKMFSTLCRELSWSHIKELIYIKEPLKRNFYIEICKLEHWSVRQLRERINSMLFERTAISKKPEETIKGDLKQLKKEQKLSSDIVFRDPYFLDFLGLGDKYSEKDLESAILVELQQFIIELGNDFAFLARQKRITIDNRDYYIDLLFYHRRLKSLVAIDLKIGEFEAGFKGQMELYLRYLEKNETVTGENQPIGLILCTGKNEEHIELMQLDKSNIRVAEYLTLLPPKKLLQEKLHKAIEIAKNRLP